MLAGECVFEDITRLLDSGIIVRFCKAMSDVSIVLYPTNVIGVSLAEYAVLVAVQMAMSITVHIPAARIADRIGRKPFFISTFLCFALFPIAASGTFAMLVVAFVIGGLREIGEPSRKAMIVDFAKPHLCARSVGLYYLIRSLSITPAAIIGGLLWQRTPETPFIVAGAIGIVGTVIFMLTVDEQDAA